MRANSMTFRLDLPVGKARELLKEGDVHAHVAVFASEEKPEAIPQPTVEALVVPYMVQ